MELLDQIADKFVVGDGCWEWTAARTSHGYGHFKRNGRWWRAHRVLYELFVGPIPSDLQVDHLCRNRACVRPSHLEAVTCRENLVRGDTQIARQVTVTHCPRGHPYAGSNLYVYGGHRYCRDCKARWR